MKRLVWLGFVVLVLQAQTSFARVLIPAPDVKPGQFVYAVPENFDPEYIGRSGLRDIQQEVSKLKYPYYVVIVEQFGGESDEDAATAIDELVANWQKDPDFDAKESSVFLLSYSPRKYRFLAGARWKTELGFEREAHHKYDNIFERYAKGTPKDPKSGIIEMAKAVDAYLARETDPKVIAERQRQVAHDNLQSEIVRMQELLQSESRFLPKDTTNYRKQLAEAEKILSGNALESMRSGADTLRKYVAALDKFVSTKQFEAQKLLEAQAGLDGEIQNLESLLRSPRRFLPGYRQGYAKSLRSAKAVRKRNDRLEMLSETRVLHDVNRMLSRFVDAKRSEQRWRNIRAFLIGLMFGLMFLICIRMFFRRAMNIRAMRAKFEQAVSYWERRLEAAVPQYLRFDEERKTILTLDKITGQTKELYDRVTHEVDEIFIALEALRTHFASCRALAVRATYLNPRPLKQALDDLNGCLEFDKGAVSQEQLFGKSEGTISARAEPLMEELEARYRRSIEEWQRLKVAAEARIHPAEEGFPHKNLDEMLEIADANSIPRRWLADHPLYGDDDSDTTLYDSVNACRWNDPVAYMARMDELLAKEKEAQQRLKRLLDAVSQAKSNRLESPPSTSGTVLSPKDDPRIIFQSARQEEERLKGLLAGSDNIEVVVFQAGLVHELYSQCAEQTAAVQSAISEACEVVAAVEKEHQETVALCEETEERIDTAGKVHLNIGDAQTSLEQGLKFQQAGEAEMADAKKALADNNHFKARQSAWSAREHFEQAKIEFDNCQKQCDELDEAREQCEKQLAKMTGIRTRVEKNLKRYGCEEVELGGYDEPAPGVPLNYILLLATLQEVENSWHNEERAARREYEAEQVRIREAEESERRSRYESSRSSDDSWSSSWSSSSGSSWGGSDFSSSSGGSW